jgi:predicted nucleotidyltransferase
LDNQIQTIPENIESKIQRYNKAMESITEDLKEYYPKAVLLFGSLARWLSGERSDHPPNDIDLLIVSNSRPLRHKSDRAFQAVFQKRGQTALNRCHSRMPSSGPPL